MPHATEIAGRTLDVIVECDAGRKRAGVATVEESIALRGGKVVGELPVAARGRLI